MDLVLYPEMGPPLPVDTPACGQVALDFADRVAAMNATLVFLHAKGMSVPRSTPEDREVAAALLMCYAADAERTSRAATTLRMSKMTAPALRHIDRMLKDFGDQAVGDAAQIRTFVQNKLLEEADNPDPKVRLKALEMLGKITDVGLFTERSQVTVTHETSEDIRSALRNKLEKFTSGEVIDAEVLPTDEEEELQSLISRLGD